jgi:hypothetical protein
MCEKYNTRKYEFDNDFLSQLISIKACSRWAINLSCRCESAYTNRRASGFYRFFTPQRQEILQLGLVEYVPL